MADASHFWSADLVVGATGDLAIADSVLESQQRILRRLLTNPKAYLWQPGYGAGLPSYIGRNLDTAALTGLITSQMYLERSVQPTPQVSLQEIPGGISAQILYTEADGETVPLNFSTTA